jgi:hypothetical protein
MDTAPMARAKGFVDKEEKLMCCEEFMYEWAHESSWSVPPFQNDMDTFDTVTDCVNE